MIILLGAPSPKFTYPEPSALILQNSLEPPPLCCIYRFKRYLTKGIINTMAIKTIVLAVPSLL